MRTAPDFEVQRPLRAVARPLLVTTATLVTAIVICEAESDPGAPQDPLED